MIRIHISISILAALTYSTNSNNKTLLNEKESFHSRNISYATYMYFYLYNLCSTYQNITINEIVYKYIILLYLLKTPGACQQCLPGISIYLKASFFNL